MRNPRSLALACCSALLATCGGDPAAPQVNNSYALTGGSPYPERFMVGDQVRTILVREEFRTGADQRGNTCGLTALVFEVTNGSTVLPTTIDNDNNCRLYVQPVEAQYPRQRFQCVGALGVSNGGTTEQFGLCPQGASTPAFENDFRSCQALLANRRVRLTSGNEGIMGDVLMDLDAEVDMPGVVTIVKPSELPTATWPAAGDLDVEWRGLDATSAVVMLESMSADGPRIWCTPRINGQVRIRADMIEQVMFRTRDARVRIVALRDRTVMAEGGARAYRLSGASINSVRLQGRR
ncbi:MAG: hypothetical protein HY909_27745 [Deltaproteobacteria bacterium]|nr:hypothetical protein [Deltaproteobacteria bacterium]